MDGHRSTELEQAWPLLHLCAVHEDLVLREATDDDVVAMARIVEDGIVEAGDERFMPRLLNGRAATVEARRADFLKYHWGRRSTTSAAKWDLAFAVVLDGEVVGCQSVHTAEFPVLREVHTGSYLARRAQNRGVGSRMRAMVLDLSFGPFGAQWASSGFVEGNERSRRVSARLGYEADGIELFAGDRGVIKSFRLRLGLDAWREQRPSWLDEVTWSSVDTASRFLGI